MTTSYSQGLKCCQTDADDAEKGKGAKRKRAFQSLICSLLILSPKQLFFSPPTLGSPLLQFQCRVGPD